MWPLRSFQIAVHFHTDLKVDQVRHICTQFAQPFLVEEECVGEQLRLGMQRELHHCFHEIPGLGIHSAAARCCFWQVACTFKPRMSTSDINSAQCYLLHEELLLEMDRVVNQEGPQTSNLMICHVLEKLGKELM